MTANKNDLTQPIDLTHEKSTGPFRTKRPIYLNLLPPCNNACPAGENIQAWLSLATEGKFFEAWQTILNDNPMPAVHGRVCYHPCELACNREQLDGSVSIHAVERFLGDKALAENWTPKITAKASGKKVLVIGAGPSGLSCAHHLALLGHQVTILEAGPLPGGMMHFGIPAYRLPRNVLMGEIARIERMGVKIVLNHPVTDAMAEKEAGGYDAVFIAVGAGLGKRTEIPARDAGKVLDAVKFLRDVELGNPPKLGRRVAIYGGGNTAMDAARVAKRLGVEPLIIYRRDRDHMPAHPFEADEAMEEGVKIHWLRTIKSIEADEFQVEEMELDENGKPKPTGRFETLKADDLIMALGQDTDTSFLDNVPGIKRQSDGTVEVDGQMMTGCPGVFAGGDMVPSERSVTIAVGHGKKAARNIDAFLSAGTYAKAAKKDLASFDKLRLWYYTEADKQLQEHLEMKKRRETFDEVLKGLDQKGAIFEAKRCLSCGNCFECDGCFGACPEDAIVRLGKGKGYEVKYELCTGCATCFDQCPCYAISMIPEPAPATAGV